MISEADRAAGTASPSTAMSWLPVARRPDTVQVSITSTSAAGISTSRMSGRPLSSMRGAPPSATTQPPMSQSQFATLLQKRQRPPTLSVSPSASARPIGANTPPTTPDGSPQTSRAASGSRYAASIPAVAHTATHQPAAPSPAASVSTVSSSSAGGASPPPSEAGTQSRYSPAAASSNESSTGRRRSASPCAASSAARGASARAAWGGAVISAP